MTEPQSITINIDLDALVRRLVRDKDALRVLAAAVQETQTKQALRTANLYGNKAQIQPKPKPKKVKLN